MYVQSPKMNQFNILKAVAADAHVTQAELARHSSLSVAMVNNYMKELCSSGLIEYHRKNSKTMSYHLTQRGAEQLEALHLELMLEMASLIASAQALLRERIAGQAKGDLRRVVILGSGHLARLAFHALESAGLKILGICDDDPKVLGNDFCGRQILSSSQIRFIAPDAVVVADSQENGFASFDFSELENSNIKVIRLLSSSTSRSPREENSRQDSFSADGYAEIPGEVTNLPLPANEPAFESQKKPAI